MKRSILFLSIAFSLIFSASAYSYDIQITGNIPLTDNVTAISVNPATGLAAAVSSETKTLYMVDTNSRSVIKKISLDMIPSGVAVDVKRNSAIVSSGDGTLHFFDLETGGLIKTISMGKPIHSIADNGGNDTLLIGNSNSLMVMDLETGNIVKEISLVNVILAMDIDKDFGNLLTIMEGKEGFFLYNAHTLELVSEINFPFGEGGMGGFSGIAVNPSTHIAVLTNHSDSSISVVSLKNKTLINTIPFNENPNAIAIDPTRNIALVAHKNGIAILKLENPVPVIDRLIPESGTAGDPGFALSIEGSKFVRDSKASWKLKELNTLFESNKNLKAIVPSEELLSSGDIPVSLMNPLPGGGTSNSLIFKIFNPLPQIESITPDAVALTQSSIALRVSGKNFLPNSVVSFNGKNLKTRFISSILLEAALDLSEIKTPSQYPVVVINPTPVSFTSNTVFLNIVTEDEYLQITAKGREEAKKDDLPKETGTLTGRILDTNKQPIEGVAVRIRNVKAETDANGYFTLNDVPSGKRHLMIHGETAKKKDGHHPTIPLTVYIEPNKINNMPFQIYLHKQKNRNFKGINSNEDTILTDREVPGFEMRIPKGVKIKGWDGNANLKVSVTTVPTDRLPVKPLPDNANVRTVYMFYFDKIGGGIPDQPIPVKSRNDLGLLPGEKAVLWYYDESPNEGEAPNDWAIAGTGTVTPDGKYIVSDPGVGIPKFCCGATAWGGSGSSGPPGGGDDGCNGGCCGSGGGPGGGGPGGGGDGPKISGTAGDPVDLATGYFIHAKTDLYVPGIIPVSISRYYRSGTNNIGTFGRNTYFEYDWWMGAYGADGKINNTNPTMFLLVKPGNYQYRFAKQPDGTFINTSDPAMHGAIATRNSDGTRTLSMKDGWTYKFDLSGDMIEIADRNGNKLTLNRHSDFEGGYLKKIITPEGRTITFNQTLTGIFFRTDSITDSTGRTVTYTYETDPFSVYPRLKTVTYPDSSSIQYQYDLAGKMSGIVNERGILEVSNEYDANNRAIRQTHSDGGVYTFSYIVAGGYVTETDMTAPNGAVTTWRFNNYGYITDKTTPDGTPRYERDPGTNQILSVTDPLGRNTAYAYDAKGRVTTLTDNAGNTTGYQYEDTFSKVTKITDALGNITTMAYDANGNLATRTAPDGKTTTFTYNSVGKPLTVTDPMANTSTMQYDSIWNLTKITDPVGNVSQMAYDDLGRLITMTDAKGDNTNYQYDIAGRITVVTDPLSSVTSYTYNLDGKLTAVVDANNHTIRYDYDSRGRLIKMTDQLGNIETYSYDTSDNLILVTDRKGQATTYTYDAVSRMTKATYSDGSYTSYTYDATGKVLTITDSVTGTISYTYSGTGCGTGCGSIADKVASETTPLGSISYTYDAIGRRTSMTVTGQPTVNYTYDTGGRLNGISTRIGGVAKNFTVTYDGLGRRSSVALLNGVTTNYTYDNSSRLLNLQHMNSLNQVLESLTYTYDATGNRISMNRPSVSLPFPNQVTNTSYNNSNQMLTFNDKNIAYDANGNVISATNTCGTTTYTWDVRNRLTGINGYSAACSTLTASFEYDALGRRIEKTINGVTTQYVYDGLDIIQEKQNGVPSVNYIRTLNIDEPLARIKADGTVKYYQTDALGSVIALTDTNGAVTTRYSYDPFGNVTVSGEASNDPFQYTGRENDGTGLYYYRARYYSPELQRFISEDPIGLSGGINFYAYVKNRPIVLRDPSGLGPPSECGVYLGCCKKSGDYCCLAYQVCKHAGDNQCSNCIRNCLIDKKCHSWGSVVPDHASCFIECQPFCVSIGDEPVPF